MEPLNDSDLLSKIYIVADTMCVELTSAVLSLRTEHPQYAHKNFIGGHAEAKGQLLLYDGNFIETNMLIKSAPGLIKDCGEARRKENEKNQYFIDLDEYEWSKEPNSCWGIGYFVNNRLWLTLYCSEGELSIVHILISNLTEKKIHVKFIISHPDHTGEADPAGFTKMTSPYRETGWYQGIFCIAGWDLQTTISERLGKRR